MIIFFLSKTEHIIAVKIKKEMTQQETDALCWLFSDAKPLNLLSIEGWFIGPRREMITPWSTTAVEITKNMNIDGIERIEEFIKTDNSNIHFDKMLQRIYEGLDQNIFTIDKKPDSIEYVSDFEAYNVREGLALSQEEIDYLKNLSKKIERPLTDSEVFGFSQVNSEHCRHKIFNGTFIIDGKEMESSLFKMIKKTSSANPGRIVSAYKDNCAFIEGPKIKMFHPTDGTKPDLFKLKEEDTVISLKAETHNFPTTVEPFNGAATGSGGEIRDRIAGGKGSFPIAGTAVYMTSYPRFNESEADTLKRCPERVWEKTPERKWLYQSPLEILIKASNGASDFGNKFGQPLICGALQTMEHTESKGDLKYGYDKVIMLAGGIGYAKKKDSIKDKPERGDKIILLGGDNYRIGMGGGAVSSVATGEYDNSIELNAVQRSNPEMQKRAYNAIRSIAEKDNNTIISVHDHGAGGHLNCLSELVEERGGNIEIDKLPIGDPTLSAKEIIGNESQERMGLVMRGIDTEELQKIADRERAPFYIIGETTGEGNFTLKNNITDETPIDLSLEDMFGSTPKTIMTDTSTSIRFSPIDPLPDTLSSKEIVEKVKTLLQIESVACKDWLTNKVDRSVTGLIACQQTCGEIQLPLNNLGVTAIGYDNIEGIATSLGLSPLVGLIDPAAASRMAIAESLTNIIWTPIKDKIYGISLSANWMWPCKNDGENARLYKGVKGASDFAIELGINIPTGKDSMSMTQKYPNGEKVLSPGTLIVTAVGESSDVNATIHPVLDIDKQSIIYYIPFTRNVKGVSAFPLGGTAYGQILNKVGDNATDISDPTYFKECFNTMQEIMFSNSSTKNASPIVIAGHDISSGGMITTLLEMCFPNSKGGLEIDLTSFETSNIIFSENSGIIVQVSSSQKVNFENKLIGKIFFKEIGKLIPQRELKISLYDKKETIIFNIDEMRDIWFRTSSLFDSNQVGKLLAKERFTNYKIQPLQYNFPKHFSGRYEAPLKRIIKAAIIREKGSNGDREMAWALYMAGFEVKDVHVTDLVSGRETLEDVNLIAFVGGFSNADTLGSAKGWAGALLYNKKAKEAIDRFYSRKDTLSLGVCNGCQLMAELGLITPDDRKLSPKMVHNDSHKYESAFIGVTIEDSPSILLSSLKGSKLGIWVAHGEGKFSFSNDFEGYKVAIRYNYNSYPANPNGSQDGIAGVTSIDGRHLALMPHPERCLRPYNWAHYPKGRVDDSVTPWIELFINGRKWLENQH